MTGMSVTAEERLSTLSAEQAELLNLLIEEEARQTRISALPRGAKSAAVRLPSSWSQQRLWFIDQLEGGTPAYYVPLNMRLRGPLDLDALQRAVDTLVQR